MANQDENNLQVIPDELINSIVETIIPVAPPVKRANALKSRVMSRIKGKQSFDLLTIKQDELEWSTILPGVERKILRKNAQGRVYTYLIKMQPGAIIPPHQHDADEECIMLEGEVDIGDIHLSAGDYHFAPKGSTHEPVTSKTGGLAFLCLV